MATEYIQITCPVCGTAHGRRAETRIGYVRFNVENHYVRALREHKMDHPFGVAQGTGRGNFTEVEHFGVDDPRAEPFKDVMKKLFLKAIQHYVHIGIISKTEVRNALKEINVSP